ncbi:hypothetical protein H8E50_12685, partial [bacterium]|nr:hypothetical protein [bacterium]
MIDMHRKKTGVHDIRETELNIILAIDDNKAEDHEFGNSRREYFRLKDSLYACLEELSQTISELESEIENTEMLS